MPNWCSNSVVIESSDYDMLEQLVVKVTMNKGNWCDSIMPCPEDLKKVICSNKNKVIVDKNDKWFSREDLGIDYKDKLPEGYTERDLTEEEEKELKNKYGHTNWYDWNRNERGSKWHVTIEDDIEIEEGVLGGWYISLSYLSAWSPNLGVSSKLVEMGFDVEHQYWEEGGNFAGEWNTEWEDAEDDDNDNKVLDCVWESEYDFAAMLRLDHDVDERYIAFRNTWLEETKYNQVGELCMFGEGKKNTDKPIGIWLGSGEVYLWNGDKVDFYEVHNDGEYTWFERYSEIGDILNWEC